MKETTKTSRRLKTLDYTNDKIFILFFGHVVRRRKGKRINLITWDESMRPMTSPYLSSTLVLGTKVCNTDSIPFPLCITGSVIRVKSQPRRGTTYKDPAKDDGGESVRTMSQASRGSDVLWDLLLYDNFLVDRVRTP